MVEVTGVDAKRKIVTIDDGKPIPYDYLVLATGATHSYFAHPEWADIASGPKEDVTRIRSRILLAFERAEREGNVEESARSMSFVIIGGGPTGVELAGAIAEMAHDALSKDFRRIKPDLARIVLIEAGERLLGNFPKEASEYARASLEKKGVEVITGISVTECDQQGVSASDGTRFESSCVLRAAGVQASSAASWLKAVADQAGRVVVDESLRVPLFEGVFVVGDTAHVVNDD